MNTMDQMNAMDRMNAMDLCHVWSLQYNEKGATAEGNIYSTYAQHSPSCVPSGNRKNGPFQALHDRLHRIDRCCRFCDGCIMKI